MAASIRKRFVPQKDITAYELSVIMAHVHGGAIGDEITFPAGKFADLPEEIARHFVDAG